MYNHKETKQNANSCLFPRLCGYLLCCDIFVSIGNLKDNCIKSEFSAHPISMKMSVIETVSKLICSYNHDLSDLDILT